MVNVTFTPNGVKASNAANTVKILSPDTVKQGDTKNDFLVQLIKDGVPLDLTGKTVTWSAASNKGKFVTDRAATVEGDGTVGIEFTGDDVGATGSLRVEFKVAYPDGDIEKFPAQDYAYFQITRSLDDLSHVPVMYASVQYFESKVTETQALAVEAQTAASTAQASALTAEEKAVAMEAQIAQLATDGPVLSVNGQSGIVQGLATQQSVDGVTAQLADKADGKAFRAQGTNHINVISGFAGNAIAGDLVSGIITGGGQGSGKENVIGGNTANVNTGNSNASPMLTGSGANLARILGGYDNVVNALSAQISADHCFIETGATHSSIIGGANHKILAGADFSAINGGINNTISSDYAVINGGSANNISGNASVVGGGDSNNASGQNAVISGGASNQATGYRSIIAGGSNNLSSGTNAVIGGGDANKAIQSSTTIAGGSTNEANFIYGTIGGGQSNKIGATYATIPGGQLNEANGNHSYVTGLEGIAKLQGENVHSVGKFAVKGDAQKSEVILRKQVVDGAQTIISINGGSTALTLPENGTWGFTCNIVGRRVDVAGESAMFELKGLAQRIGTGAATMVGTPKVTEIGKSATANWSVLVNAVGNAIYFRVTGEAGKTINWVADLQIVQIIGQ